MATFSWVTQFFYIYKTWKQMFLKLNKCDRVHVKHAYDSSPYSRIKQNNDADIPNYAKIRGKGGTALKQIVTFKYHLVTQTQ